MSRWKTEHSEDTTAPPDSVWAIVADLDGWRRWNPGYREAHLDGPLERGTPGRVTLANGMRRTFTLVEIANGKTLAIGASGPGARQRFEHVIEPLPTGGSRVSMAATMDGPLTPILSRIFGRVIAGYYPTAVKQLARAAEAATTAE